MCSQAVRAITGNDPLVSVFILVYNAKNFIRECLDSVISQNYPNLEIIIGDDCSTDGTQEILREYESKYPHLIKLHVNPTNQGCTKNANITLARCTGKYLAIIDGDDMMLPGKIRAQVDFMESNPDCAICYHDVEHFYTNNENKSFIANSVKEGKLADVIQYYLSDGVFNSSASNFVKREYMGKYNERFLCADLIITVNILENSGGTIRHIDGVYARYRRHSNSISQSPQMLQDELLAYLYLSTRFPAYTLQGIKRCGKLYMGYRHNAHFKDFYSVFLRASLKLDFNFRALKRLLIYYLSFKKIRL